MSSSHRRPFPGSGLLIFVLCCTILYLAQEVLIPIALAALLSLVLVPAVNRMTRARCPDAASVILSVGILSLLLMGAVWLVAREVTGVVGDFPKYRDTITTRIREFTGSRMGAFAGSVSDFKRELTEGQPEKAPAAAAAGKPGSASATPPAGADGHAAPIRVEQSSDIHLTDYLSMVGTALHPFSLTAIVLLLTTFMLIQRDDLHDRFLILSGRIAGRHQLPVSMQAIDEALSTVSRYLWMQSASNAGMASIILIGLLCLGIHNAFLWGSLCFFLRFVPYVGILIGAGLTFAFAIATAPDMGTPFMVLGLFAVVEFLFSSLLEPIFFAHSTGISSLAILVSAIFWTWIWGFTGLFLSVPLTVCWVMIGRNFDNFDFLDTLLSGRAQLPPEKLLYHRLLAMDPADYAEAIEKQIQPRTFEEAYDEVMVPTVCLAESEMLAERISPERFDAILLSLRLAIEEMVDGQVCAIARRHAGFGPAPEPQASSRDRRILCLAAHGELDQLAGTMLGMALRIHGCDAMAAVQGAPHEVAEQIAAAQVQGVCISVLNRQSLERGIAWARVLRHRFPDLLIAIGQWNPRAPGAKRLERARKRYAIEVVTDLRQAVMLLSPAEVPLSPAPTG